MTVKQAFSKYAGIYDQTRRQFIPCFDDFYRIALDLIPDPGNARPRILDLGAGTGLVTAMVLERIPQASVVLADVSQAMLDQARERFAGMAGDLAFQAIDYRAGLPEGPFDVIISALSIHHLDDREKQNLFHRTFEHLVPGGIFINADQALGKTPAIDARYRKCWFREIRAAGITDEQMAQAEERMEEDRMSLLGDQLAWMGKAGFSEVNCWYQYYNFVVYSGIKPDSA